MTRHQQVEYAYIFGAECSAQNAFVGLVLPSADSKAMLVHLREISAQVSVGPHTVVVLDYAAWHTTKSIIVFDNLSLLTLPPASPELNPIEQIWQQLRDNWISNAVMMV